MHDEMRRATLAGKAEMIRIELMPIETEAEFHTIQKPMLMPPSTGRTTPVTNFAAGEQR